MLRHFLVLALGCAIAGSWVRLVGRSRRSSFLGEILIADASAGDVFEFQFDCNGDGSGTVSFSVTGRAIATYYTLDGRFAEQGRSLSTIRAM